MIAREGGVEKQSTRTDQMDDDQDRTRTRDQEHMCSICHRAFSTQHGLKVHQGKTWLKIKHSRSNDRKTRGKASQDENTHRGRLDASVESTMQEQNEETVYKDEAGKPKVKWPAAKEKEKYKVLEEKILVRMREDENDEDDEGNETFEPETELRKFARVIYEVAAEEFGIQEDRKIEQKKTGKSRREKKMEKLRAEKRALRKRWKDAPPEEKEGLNLLYEELKKKCRDVQRNVRRCERRRESKRTRERFIKNPYKAVKKMFVEPRNGSLQCTKEELDEHVRKTYSDPRREEEMPHINGLKYPSRPGVEFDLSPLKDYEVDTFIKKARAGSAPGGDGISYKVFKYCDKLRSALCNLLQVLWEDKGLVDEWCKAEGVYLPKEANSEKIGQFRPISLLGVMGKIYMGVIARRTVNYLQQNGYIDESVQKAGIPGIPGCVEHAYAIWDTIQEAKKEKEDLNVVWLDLANAYGSVPHALLMKAMDFFFIPEDVKAIMMKYYASFRMRFSTGTFTTDWHRLEIGIAAGCTISVIWFILVMEMLLRSADCTEEKAMVKAPKKAFMDDVTLSTRPAPVMDTTLARLDELITWSRMMFKAKKSRSLSLKAGVQCQTRFKIAGDPIPTVKEEPVKSLGRWYAGTLSDRSRGMEVMKQTEDGLKTIDQSKLPGKYKVWCLQFGLYPRIAWPLMIYEVALSRVEIIEQKCNTYIRKWLGLPRIINTPALYRKQGALQMPLTSIVEIYKAGKVRTVMMLRDSRDQQIRDNPPEVRSARKWKAEEATDECISILKHRDIVGSAQKSDDRSGLGTKQFKPFSTMSPREKRAATTTCVSTLEAEKREVKLVECAQQGQLLKWQEEVVERKIGWKEIWEWSTSRISFLVRATYDVLPSPANLVRWKVQENDTCRCGKKATMKHILSNCLPAMKRYTWRHNEVLKVLFEVASEQVVKSQYNVETRRLPCKMNVTTPGGSKVIPGIQFVKQGGLVPSRKNEEVSTVVQAGWEVAADLPGCDALFPIPTTRRPDLVVWHEEEKMVHLVELTVPHEDNLQDAHHRKLSRYKELVEECEEMGWKTAHYPVEVGCRGFVGVSTRRWLRVSGLGQRQMGSVIKKLQEVVEKASHWIWLKRDDETWLE